MATVKVGELKIKCFQIDPDKRYLMVIPRYVLEDEGIVAAINELFTDADAKFVGIGVKDIDDVKILTVPIKKYARSKGRNKKTTKKTG